MYKPLKLYCNTLYSCYRVCSIFEVVLNHVPTKGLVVREKVNQNCDINMYLSVQVKGSLNYFIDKHSPLLVMSLSLIYVYHLVTIL